MLDEPIPFVIKVFAADYVLEELHSSVPPVTDPKDDYASFHPIGPDPATKTKRPRTSSGKIKVKVELSRTTRVDAKCMQLQYSNSTSLGFINGTQTLSEGVIEKLTRGSDWIAWSGVIIVPEDVKCGGFTACRVEVFDHFILSILPTSSSRSPVISFCESVPVRLAARNSFGAASTGSKSTRSTRKGMEHYPPPPTSSSVASKTSWVSSDGSYI